MSISNYAYSRFVVKEGVLRNGFLYIIYEKIHGFSHMKLYFLIIYEKIHGFSHSLYYIIYEKIHGFSLRVFVMSHSLLVW